MDNIQLPTEQNQQIKVNYEIQKNTGNVDNFLYSRRPTDLM